MERIRNFSIIAHVDHGKSTLADRFISRCQGLSEREMTEQVLDSMDLERERGITIKAQTATLDYRRAAGDDAWMLNLIDTPGHADFAYEVSRSLGACEGALLVVDAAQGVQAQTLANCYKAVELGLEVVPVVNKIDLPLADVDRVAGEIRDIIGLDTADLLHCSAKTGAGVEEVLDAVVDRIRPPAGAPAAELQALVIDSYFDAYAGVVVIVRIVNGELRPADRIRFMATGSERPISELGRLTPRPRPAERLGCGEVGYVIAGLKDIAAAKVGDTITTAAAPASEPLPGFRMAKPQLYASFFPLEADLFPQLQDAFDRLKLNDAALELETESSAAFGKGIKCGFLGMLHMEIVQERLAREHNVGSIITAPGVAHEVVLTDGSTCVVRAAHELPPPQRVAEIREPLADVTIIAAGEYLGAIMQLCIARRGVQAGLEQAGAQAVSRWRMPLADLVTGFIDDLQSATRGYASLDYELAGTERADIVRVDILVNEEIVPALSLLVPREQASRRGRALLKRLADSIPRQQFQVPLQAVIGGKIIARENVKALRKNVLSKCYGGDVTRKKKLLERQKKGKRRMRMFGNVEIPQEAFLAVLQQDGNSDG